MLAVLGGLLIWRPIRRRRQQELKEAKAAAQDDLIALSAGVTDHDADVSIRSQPRGGRRAGRGAERLRAGHCGPRRGPRREGHGHGQPGHRRGPVPPGQRPGPRRRAAAGPTGAPRASSIPGTACPCATCCGRRPTAGPPRRYRPALPTRARWSRESSPRCGRWRSAGHRSATLTPASPRRTGAASASFPACSPGSCSARRSRPASGTPATSAATAMAATTGTSGTGIPATAATSAAGDFGGGDFGGGDFGGGDFGGGDFGGGDFGGGGDFS